MGAAADHRLTIGKRGYDNQAVRPPCDTVMEFCLLGPFEARHDGRTVEVGSRRQERCLLAILLLEAGRLVPTERLIDLLWSEHPPHAARGAVHTYIGRLRGALNPYGVRIVTRGDGYLVEPAGHTVDVEEFARIVRQAIGTTDPGDRLVLLDQAMDRWRGPLLADLVDEELRHRLDAELAELHLLGAELRADALLALGEHARVVSDLTVVAEQHPTRERLVGVLMTALYRSGRQADALLLYRTTRQLLVDSLGVEPGAELHELHRRILRSDHRLDAPRRSVYEVRVRDQSLPWTVGGHPALEFCNTFAGWGHEPPLPGSEWLRSYQTLAVWTGYTDLADEPTVSRLLDLARRHPDVAAAELDLARDLRARLYRVFTDPGDHEAFTAFTRHAEDAAKVLVLSRDADGRGRWHPGLSAGLRLPLHAVAWSAAQLLADPRRTTVRACPHERCGWLFLDASGMRRWCSLATCGQPVAVEPSDSYATL
jgi:SARP family transcriptional regulator, regulator of embCAB operon